MKRTLAAALALALLAACHNDRAVGVSHAAPSAPLYLVDGKEVTFGQVEGMSSSTIESVEVVRESQRCSATAIAPAMASS